MEGLNFRVVVLTCAAFASASAKAADIAVGNAAEFAAAVNAAAQSGQTVRLTKDINLPG